MIQIFCWNVRGLNDPAKRGLIKSALSKFSRSIFCLQETKVEAVSRSFLRSFAGSLADKCQFTKAEGGRGYFNLLELQPLRLFRGPCL